MILYEKLLWLISKKDQDMGRLMSLSDNQFYLIFLFLWRWRNLNNRGKHFKATKKAINQVSMNIFNHNLPPLADISARSTNSSNCGLEKSRKQKKKEKEKIRKTDEQKQPSNESQDFSRNLSHCLLSWRLAEPYWNSSSWTGNRTFAPVSRHAIFSRPCSFKALSFTPTPVLLSQSNFHSIYPHPKLFPVATV